MSRYEIRLTAIAGNDLQEIVSYITYQLYEPEAAKRLLKKLQEAIVSLEEMPARHSLVLDENLARRGVRRILVDRYIVFYLIEEEEKQAIILRILYSKRNWQSLV